MTFNDHLNIMIGYYTILFTSCLFISSAWFLTNMSTLVMSIGILVYYRFMFSFSMGQLSTSIMLIMFLIMFATYYTEKRVKLEFI